MFKVFGRRLTVSNYVHDKYGKANGVIKQYFKDSKEKLDVAHGIKNIIKKITNQEWKTRVKITLFYCLRNCSNNPEKLKNSLQVWLHHWSGDHSKCINCSKSQHLDLNLQNWTFQFCEMFL